MYCNKIQLLLCVYIISMSWIPLVMSANILLSGVYGEGSHFLTMAPIGKSLVEKGHNVTFLISDVYGHLAKDPKYSNMFNFEIFTCDGLKERMDKMFPLLHELAFAKLGVTQLITFATFIGENSGISCDAVLSDVDLMKRLENIDAIVLDVAWPCAVHIKAYLYKYANVPKIRLIMVSASTPVPHVLQMAGSHFNPSYQPVPTTAFTSTMSFFERILNTLTYNMFTVFSQHTFYKPYHALVDKFELHPDLKISYQEYTDLYLINSDFAIEFPFPLMPNVIAVGGLTSRPAKPLEKELEEFMQSSGDHGVVVFTLGTYLASAFSTRPEIVKMFVDAFSRIPQKVLFQLKDMPEYELSPNIKALPWLPQNDLLGHPKTRVFMYHGGNNGFQEAIYHGVPIVVMPLLGDQGDVAARIVARGIGTQLDKHQLSADYIYGQLAEVLQNPQYNQTAKRISAIFRDRPMKPADRAAFWIEHVIKHGGNYMHSPVHNLSFIQLYLIDTIALLAIVLGITCYVCYRVLRFCMSCCGRSRTQKIAKDKRE